MNKIKSWMSHHPFKVVLFTFLFTLIPAIMAVTNENFFYYGIGAFAAFLVVWVLCVRQHSKNLITAFLVVAMLACGIKPARTAGVGVAVVVVCVGGYCVYKMVKTCQKVFPPKNTNAPPSLTASGGEDEYAGAYEYSSIGSCYTPPTVNAFPYEDLSQNPTTFTLNVMLQSGMVLTSMKASNEEGTTQTWDEFKSEMTEHGLFLTGHSSWQPQYAINGVPCDGSENGVPCDGSEVPLSFDQPTGRVTHNTGGEIRRVSIERSPNLVDWFPLMVTDVSDNTGFKVIDTTREGQMFYRVQVTQP